MAESSVGRPRAAKESDRRGPILSWLCLSVIVVSCYGGVLFGGRQFAFRDAAHFYYPLYQRVQHEWSAGRLPLWEPGENGGTTLLGSPMAAVLYPGKLIFAIVPFSWGIRLYTVGHEVLAFWAMIALMRAWGVSETGATLAGLSYAFGGVVFSNYFNIIYLVGAAWLPLGIRASDGWLRLGRRSALAELAVVLAMQCLGGDLEVAYLTGVCAVGYALGLARCGSGAAPRPAFWGALVVIVAVAWLKVGPTLTSRLYSPGGRLWGQVLLVMAWGLGLVGYTASRKRGHRARLSAMLAGLVSSGVLAIALTAVTMIPVAVQMAGSVRWAGDGLEDRYDSSLLPYRVVECIWPNVFGTFTAGNRYGITELPPVGAARPSPLSLYSGALPLILALGAARFRNGPAWRSWMTAVALLSLWAALGEFAGRERWGVSEPSPTAGDDSFYGLLAALLPGFRLFRLPFKLLVFTSLALSALAGLGWDAVQSGNGRRRTLAIAVTSMIVTAAVLVAVAASRGQLVAAIAARNSTHAVFGPMDAAGVVREMLKGLGHGAIALASTNLVILWAGRRQGSTSLAALVFVTIDLAVAQAPLVIAIPQADFEREPELVRVIRDAEKDDPAPGPFRVQRLYSWVPIGWEQVKSDRRLREVIDWEIDTLQPGYGLLHGISYVFDDQSQTASADVKRLFQPALRRVDPDTAAVLGVEPGRQVLHYPRGAFDLWGARYFIIPAYPGDWSRPERSYAGFLDQTDLIYPNPAALEGPERSQERLRWLLTKDVQVRRSRTAFRRAWIVHDARRLTPLGLTRPALREALMVRLRSPDPLDRPDGRGPTSDLRSSAYIETDEPSSLTPYLPGVDVAADSTESVAVRSQTPTRVVIEAHLRRPGIVVLAETFDPSWRLAIDGIPAAALRTNLLMRGAAVDAGPHTLVYTYDPTSVRIGAYLSLAALAVLASLGLWARRQPDARAIAEGH